MVQVNGKSHPLLIFTEPPEEPFSTNGLSTATISGTANSGIVIEAGQCRILRGPSTLNAQITIKDGGRLHLAGGNSATKVIGSSTADIVIKPGGRLSLGGGAVLQLTHKPISIEGPMKWEEETDGGAVAIAGGAVVEGTFKFNGCYNRFTGRGILTSGHISWKDFKNWETSDPRVASVIQFDTEYGQGLKHYFEGLMLLNTPGWTAKEELINSEVVNIKQISWNGNSDGFHLNTGCKMRDSFFFNNDDALVLGIAENANEDDATKAWSRTGSNNIWSSCTVSPGKWGQPIVAYSTNNVNINNTWQDIDIIAQEESIMPIIGVKLIDDTKGRGRMENFLVKNVRIDSTRNAPLFQLSPNAYAFTISNFVLENITATTARSDLSQTRPEIQLVANTSSLQEITIKNVKVCDQFITPVSGGNANRFIRITDSAGNVSSSTNLKYSLLTPFNWWKTPTSATLQQLNWNIQANWTGGDSTTDSIPKSSPDTRLHFFLNQTLNGINLETNNDVGALRLNSLTLSGTSTNSPRVKIKGHQLEFCNADSVNPKNSLNPTISLDAKLVNYDVALPLVLHDETTILGAPSGNIGVSGAISGAGRLSLNTTAGTLVLSGTNTYTGGTTIVKGGCLQIGGGGGTGSLGSGPVMNNGDLIFNFNNSANVNNAIAGTGTVSIACNKDTGNVALSGQNSFTGNVTVESGALWVTNPSSLGVGPKKISLTRGSAGNSKLLLNGSAITLPAHFTFLTSNGNGAIINMAGDNTILGPISLDWGGGNTTILSNKGRLTLAGKLAPIQHGRALVLGGTSEGEVKGLIENGDDTWTLGVTKKDAGTWTLNAANSYSGDTAINAGTVKLGSPQALGHGGMAPVNATGATIVAAGATLDLNGQSGVAEVFYLNGSGVGGVGALVNNNINSPANIYGSPVSSLTLTAGGRHSTVPSVTITPIGAGSGATATATLGVTAASFSITVGTQVYSAAPGVEISGGGGTGATANAVLNDAGLVSGVEITNPGTGFTTAPNITFWGGTVKTTGALPSSAGNADNFTVSGLKLTRTGQNYVTAPTVSFYKNGTKAVDTAAEANMPAVILGSNAAIGGTGNMNITAPISGAFSLSKVGTGRLTLGGTTSYTGPTTLSAGTLVVNNAIGSESVTVAAGAILSGGAMSWGGGEVMTNTTVLGTLSPGDGLGGRGRIKITGDTLTFGASSHLQWKLGDHYTNQTYSSLTGWNFDSVTAKTVIVKPGALLDIKLDATGSSVELATPENKTNNFWLYKRTWTILSSTTSSLNGNFKLGTVSADSNNRSGQYRGSFSITSTAENLDLVWTPEWVLREEWQKQHFSTNWNTEKIGKINADPDGDGLSNEQERIMGSDPNVTNAHSPLNITVAKKQITLSFELPVASGPGFTGLKRCYSLESTTTLVDPLSWKPVNDHAKVPATGGLVTVTQPVATPASFYRLRVWLEPEGMW